LKASVSNACAHLLLAEFANMASIRRAWSSGGQLTNKK